MVPIKSHHAENITKAWNTTFQTLKLHGEAPNIHILDNECLREMKDSFTAANVKYQLVPPMFTDAMQLRGPLGQQKIT